MPVTTQTQGSNKRGVGDCRGDSPAVVASAPPMDAEAVSGDDGKPSPYSLRVRAAPRSFLGAPRAESEMQ